MRHVILASHGDLARGMYDTVGMIVGEVDCLTAFVLARDDRDPIADRVRAKLDACAAEDEIIICTDMVGSSVNNDMVGLLHSHPNVTLVSGMNLPLVIGLVMNDGPLTAQTISEIIAQAGAGIKNCGQALSAQGEEDDDL